MPKVYLTMEGREAARRKAADNALRGLIGRYMMQAGETRTELSERMGISRPTLARRISNPEEMTLGELRTILKIVGASAEERAACL